MKKIFTIVILLFICVQNFAQEKQNNILFPEGSLGLFSYKGQSSISLAVSLNYQYKKNLFTVRKRLLTSVPHPENPYESILKESSESSILYGRRFIKNGFSYSFSAGVSKASNDQYHDINKKFERTT